MLRTSIKWLRYGRWVFVGLCVVTTAGAAEWPAPFEARYTGSHFPLSANATITLERLGDYYRYTMRASVYMTVFKMGETYDCSVLRIRDGGLQTLAYVHRNSRKPSRNLQVRFNREVQTIEVKRGDGSTFKLEHVTGDVWDPMSVQVRMRADVLQAPVGAKFDYAVFEKDEIRHYDTRYVVVEKAGVGTDDFNVAKITARDGDTTNTFWFAKDYAWLPVRLTISGVTLSLASAPERARREAAASPKTMPGCE